MGKTGLGRRALLALLLGPLCLGLAGCTGGAKVAGQERLLEAPGRLSVERFRIGWYDDANNLGTPEALACRGFDFTMPYVGDGDFRRVDAYLAASKEAGLPLYLEVPGKATLAGGKTLDAYIDRYGRDEAVLGWYLYDEPELKLEAFPALLEGAYARIKRAVPGLPISLVFNSVEAAPRYARAMDRLWFDFYPVAAGSREFDAFREGRYADAMRRAGQVAARLGMPLFMVLQGYGEDRRGQAQFGRRLPTKAESRYMLYASLLARPSSLVYWTFYRSKLGWIDESLVPLIREFRARFPRGIVYEAAEGFSASGADCDLLALSNEEGRTWLLLLSREGRAAFVRVGAPSGWAFAESGNGQMELRLERFGAELTEIVRH